VRLSEYHSHVGPVLEYYREQTEVTVITIKMREIAPSTQPPPFASRNVHHKSTLLPIDANAEQVLLSDVTVPL
jgi:hypothetical protein